MSLKNENYGTRDLLTAATSTLRSVICNPKMESAGYSETSLNVTCNVIGGNHLPSAGCRHAKLLEIDTLDTEFQQER
jgi:hypothetical protein